VIDRIKIYVVAEQYLTFGVLHSAMHMAWVRNRGPVDFKSDFRYSAGIVYNNFLADSNWQLNGSASKKLAKQYSRSAIHICLARASTLADLLRSSRYARFELSHAHAELDRAVDRMLSSGNFSLPNASGWSCCSAL